MSYDLFLMRVMHRTGLDDSAQAQSLTFQVLEYLSQSLPPEHAQAIAEELPAPLAARLLEIASYSEADLDTLYRAVADEQGLDLSFAAEFTQVTLQVLGEFVGLEGRARLAASLPAEWHIYFEPRKTPQKPEKKTTPGHTLASGKPGSTRKLSSAQPGHRNSIAVSDDPHSGQRLSTSSGAPRKRTLAEGRPGSTRPLSEASDHR